MSDALILRNDTDRKVSFLPKAHELRKTALVASALIGRVSDAVENAAATEAMRELQTVIKGVEDARVVAKAPVLEFGRQIDDAAKSFVADLKAEQMRVAKLVGDFQQLENAKRQAAERAAQLERERIERERRAEEERIRREQYERENREALAAQEVQRKIREASDAKAREEAERAAIELQRNRELAVAKSHEELEAAQQRANEAQAAVFDTTPAPVRAIGQTVKPKKTFDVVDIHALYRHHPNCVKLEPLLKEIQSLVDAGMTPKGIGNIRDQVKVSVRANRSPAAIDV